MGPGSASSKSTISRRPTIPSPSGGNSGASLFTRPSIVAKELTQKKVARELMFWLKGWAFSFAGWGMVAFVLGAKLVLDTGGPWAMTIRPTIRDWLPWAIMTPIIFRFVMRFPIDRRGWKTTIPLHLFSCAAVVSLCQWWQSFSDPHFRPAPLPPPLTRNHGDETPMPPPFPPGPGWKGHEPNEPHRRSGPPGDWVDLFHLVTFGLPIYLMIVSGAHAAVYFRRDQQRAASLALARLDVLKGQLQPHFLFNTLNVIAELVHDDPEKADAMITALSEMLRLTLDSASEQLVPLERETDFVERYLAIMQIRLGKRLRYECYISPDARGALVPPFLLQPLAENAVLHGIEPMPSGGMVKIFARVRGEELLVSVTDDGVGIETPPEREGIGLANTRARLTELFGEAAQVNLTNGRGVTVEVVLPLRT